MTLDCKDIISYNYSSIASQYDTLFFFSCKTKYKSIKGIIGEKVATDIPLVSTFRMIFITSMAAIMKKPIFLHFSNNV